MPYSASLATNIHRLSTVLNKHADKALQEACGIGTSQFKILWVLYTHQDGVLQTNIADWLGQTEAAVSRQINLIANEGLIRKKIDKHNRRNHVILLTKSGKNYAQHAMEVITQEYRPYFSVLTVDEQRVLNDMLEKVFQEVVKRDCIERK